MKYIMFLGLSIFLSCSSKRDCSLEITFTSKNSDTISVLKAVWLTLYERSAKQQGFHNIQSSVPNKFVLNSIDTGLYIGLIEIERNEGRYNIILDSILIKSGINKLTKEINLGTVRL